MTDTLMSSLMRGLIGPLFVSPETCPYDSITINYLGPFGLETVNLVHGCGALWDDFCFDFQANNGHRVRVNFYSVAFAFARKGKEEFLHILNFKARKDDSLKEAAKELNAVVKKYGITRDEVPNPAKQLLNSVICIRCRKDVCECPKSNVCVCGGDPLCACNPFKTS